MKIALIGASGFVGTAILNEALERGHEVKAIVRHTSKLKEQKNLKIVEADVMNTDALVTTLSGSEIVISAYNAGWTNPNLYNEFLEGSTSIQEAVRKSGIKRLVIVGGAGSLFIAPDVQLVDTPDFPEAFRAGAAAARDYLNMLKKENDLEWTFISPAIEMSPLSLHERTGTYRTGRDNPVFDENHRSKISVEDFAVAIVDEAESPKHIRVRFTVAY